MSLRRMTSGELTLARSIFENTIDYSKVWIHNEKYLPGQGERTAIVLIHLKYEKNREDIGLFGIWRD
ncbi:hypothetical protein GJ11_08900 [Escherichia coli]|nr:hypothetical protein GJ11_08900 [Escherichia coli]